MQIIINFASNEVEEALLHMARERFNLNMPHHTIRCTVKANELGGVTSLIMVAETVPEPEPEEEEIDEQGEEDDEIEPAGFIRGEGEVSV